MGKGKNLMVSRSVAVLVVVVLAVLVTLRVRFAVDQLRELGNGDGNGRVAVEVRGEDEGLGVEGGELEGVASLHKELAEAGWQWLAVGQEPGWRVLVDSDGALVLSMIGVELEGYVVDVLDGDGNFFEWKAMVAGDSMSLEFTREDCVDTMSGYEFAYRVQMAFGDRVYSGCGKALVP